MKNWPFPEVVQWSTDVWIKIQTQHLLDTVQSDAYVSPSCLHTLEQELSF